MQSLIIHLPRSAERQPNVARLVQQLPKASVVNAVDGRDPAQTGAAPQRAGDLFQPAYPFALLPGEVGCFLSHRACWQQILTAGCDAAIIAEDDLLINAASWGDLQRLIQRNTTPDSYIRLPQKPREICENVLDQQGKMALFSPRHIGLTTTFQVVGRNAARRLLQHSEQIDRPVDTFLQMHWITGQPMQVIMPNGTGIKGFKSGSTVQQKKNHWGQKMWRELARMRYRRAVKKHPQSG